MNEEAEESDPQPVVRVPSTVPAATVEALRRATMWQNGALSALMEQQRAWQKLGLNTAVQQIAQSAKIADPLAGMRRDLFAATGVGSLAAAMQQQNGALSALMEQQRAWQKLGLNTVLQQIAENAKIADPLAGMRRDLFAATGVGSLAAAMQSHQQMIRDALSARTAYLDALTSKNVLAAQAISAAALGSLGASGGVAQLLDWQRQQTASIALLHKSLAAYTDGPRTAQTIAGLALPQLRLDYTTQLSRGIAALVPKLPAVSEWTRKWAEQITLAREYLLPANLRAFGDQDWARLLDISAEDGIILLWAPRPEIIRELLDAADDPLRRRSILQERRDDVFEDVISSLASIEHPDVVPHAERVASAIRAAQDGHHEAALALLNTVVDRIGTEFSQHLVHEHSGQFQPRKNGGAWKTGTILSLTWNLRPAPTTFRSWEYLKWLIVAGMQFAFASSAVAINHYSRHRVAHLADEDALSERHFIPGLLVAQGLLRHWEEVVADQDEADVEV